VPRLAVVIALALALGGCPKLGSRGDGDGGELPRDAGSIPDAGTSVTDGGAGLPFDGAFVLDDDRVRGLDPTSLPAGASPCRAPILARVTHVTDGDTITVSGLSETLRSQRVRMIGVDTPELADEGKPAECYSAEATAFTAQLDERLVWLTFDRGCIDIHDRLLAYVHVGGGEGDLWERQLLRRGLARVLVIPPNDMLESRFRSDQTVAESAPVGLWRDCP
jgi:micrococcal nuclease